MATTHEDAVRNLIADTVTALVDAGGGVGKLVLKQTSDDAVVSTLDLNTVAYNAAAAAPSSTVGLADLNTTVAVEDPSATGGTAGYFKQQDFAGTVIFSGSVSDLGGSGDMKLSTDVVPPLATVSLTAGNYTAPV